LRKGRGGKKFNRKGRKEEAQSKQRPGYGVE